MIMTLNLKKMLVITNKDNLEPKMEITKPAKLHYKLSIECKYILDVYFGILAFLVIMLGLKMS